MKTVVSYKANIEYIFLTLALMVTFWLLSIFDIFTSNEIPNAGLSITYKLLNDSWTGLLIGLLFFPLCLILTFIKKRVGIVSIIILFLLIVLIQIGLIKYSQTTHLNLGADLLGYSMSDIFITVSASESISFLYVLPFILFPLLFLGIYFAFKKLCVGKEKTLFVFLLFLLVISGSIKFLVSDLSEAEYQNKLYFLISDIVRVRGDESQMDIENITYKKEFPVMKAFENQDVLAPFFEIHKEKPNIVMIIVEGLGDEFIGNNNYAGFTPYLDSLIPQSLYWENFVSNAGRTFGVLPSLLGSLPFGEKGFLELDPLPSHISLISILKANGYSTSYYSGDESSFDRRINFLEYNGIDNVIDINKFGTGYIKTQANSGGFSWGYPDAEIFKKMLTDLGEKQQPRLDIIMTLTNHEPFDFPSKNIYLTKVDSVLNTKTLKTKEISDYKDVFACLLYTDNSIKNFMTAYAKRPEFNNTIFIITGDHRLIPIPQKDNLCRFHVPFYIYSPMLKKTARFKSISSHWDVTPSLVSFLAQNYGLNKPEKTSWMSNGLDTARQFRNIHKIAFMRYKGSINDYLYKNYLYSDGKLFKINENFETKKISKNSILKTMSDSLMEFKKLNAYLTKKNKIYPNSLNEFKKTVVEFSDEELITIKQLTTGLNFDQIFIKSREFAFNKEHKKTLLLCDYILNERPNFVDARILKGRTLAWDNDYKNSEKELLDAIKRSPFYYDGYSALMDVYKWSDQDAKAIAIGKKALKNDIQNPEIGFKLASLYKKTNNFTSANKTIDSILKIYPKNTEYITFKNSLKR